MSLFSSGCRSAFIRCRFVLSLTRNRFAAFSSSTLTNNNDFAPTQKKYLGELCIQVNEKDEIIGPVTKHDCHILQNINNGMIHRAFSVFLFNRKHELLIQQRSEEKILYPGLWSNTCCSHPLHTEGEMEAEDSIGIKRAAKRRLNFELGIPVKDITKQEFVIPTRLRYKANNIPDDGKFGENEIDHVVLIEREVNLKINPYEIKDYKYISQADLKKAVFASDATTRFTPWFLHIARGYLFKWWNQLDELQSLQPDHEIHHVDSLDLESS